MPVWLKEKLRSIAEKRQSSKYSPHCVRGLHKLGRLASEIKAKRQSLAAKAGFSTTIVDFVANSHLSWITTYPHRSARTGEKKRLWKPREKSSKKTHLPAPAAAPSSSRNPAIELSHDRHRRGQGTSTEEINVEDCRSVHKQQAPPGLAVVYRRVFTVVRVVILSLSPLLEAKKVVLQFTTLALFSFGVMYTESQSSHSTGSCLHLIQFLNFVIANFVLFFNHTDKPFKFQENPPASPESGLSQSKRCASDTELDRQQHLRSAFPPNTLHPSENVMAIAEHPGIHSDNVGNPSARGIKKLRSKLLRKLVFRRCSSPQNSPNTKNGTGSTTIAFSHSARACPASSAPPSETVEMGKGRMSRHSDFDIQTEARGESISQASKFHYSKSNTGSVDAEKLKINSKEKKCGSSSFLLLLTVVLYGLTAGRLPALAWALCWCLFIKAVELKEKHSKASTDAPIYTKARDVC